MIKRVLIVAVIVLWPLAAWALDTAANRFTMSKKYIPGSDLTTSFGRFAMGGYYIPGGQEDGGGPIYGTPTGRKKLLLGIGS